MKKSKRKKPSADLRVALSGAQGLGRVRSSQKSASVIFRVTTEEKDEIREMAERLGLSVSAYLLDLHRIVRERLDA